MVSLYFVYKPKKNAPRTDITNDDQDAYKYGQTYGDEPTSYHHNMISIVVFFYKNTLKSMLVDCAVTEMGCFDDYSDAAPRAKNMRGNGINTFLLHISKCIPFNIKKFVTETLIADALLKSLYSRLDFKVIKYFATSPNLKRLARNLNMSQENPKNCRNKQLACNVI